MSAVYITNASSWEEADEHFAAFMAVVPAHRTALAERVAESGGPALDGSLGSLVPLTEWFIRTALKEPPPPAVDYWPAWLEKPKPGFVPTPEHPGTPAWLMLLWEQVGVYVGDVMMAMVRGSRWVCWRAKHPRDIQNGMPLIDIGRPTMAFDAMGAANAGVPRTYSRRLPPESLKTDRTLTHVQAVLADREEYLASHPVRWQAAPTGPRAKRSQTTPGG